MIGGDFHPNALGCVTHSPDDDVRLAEGVVRDVVVIRAATDIRICLRRRIGICVFRASWKHLAFGAQQGKDHTRDDPATSRGMRNDNRSRIRIGRQLGMAMPHGEVGFCIHIEDLVAHFGQRSVITNTVVAKVATSITAVIIEGNDYFVVERILYHIGVPCADLLAKLGNNGLRSELDVAICVGFRLNHCRGYDIGASAGVDIGNHDEYVVVGHVSYIGIVFVATGLQGIDPSEILSQHVAIFVEQGGHDTLSITGARVVTFGGQEEVPVLGADRNGNIVKLRGRILIINKRFGHFPRACVNKRNHRELFELGRLRLGAAHNNILVGDWVVVHFMCVKTLVHCTQDNEGVSSRLECCGIEELAQERGKCFFPTDRVNEGTHVVGVDSRDQDFRLCGIHGHIDLVCGECTCSEIENFTNFKRRRFLPHGQWDDH